MRAIRSFCGPAETLDTTLLIIVLHRGKLAQSHAVSSPLRDAFTARDFTLGPHKQEIGAWSP